MLEDAAVFGPIIPTSCHIADYALYRDFDLDADNRLYLTQDAHVLFDGRQLINEVPHFAIYFVSYDGQESIEFNGTRHVRDKVTIGIEAPFADVYERIRFKNGSFRSADGVMHTFVHVRSHTRFKAFLDLKYLKTTNIWVTKGVV